MTAAAFGQAVLRARIRVAPEDFRVDEDLGFEPDGEGEHLLLRVEKTGANTDWVARKLAEFAGVAPVAVGYAGLKDRHAVTTQSFSLHWPGRDLPELSRLDIEGVRVVAVARHRRKLPRGALRGNRFEVILREVSGDRRAIDARLQTVADGGFPNAFGEQRFGRGGDNAAAAERWFKHGGRLPRARRSILLSSARSALFNAVLDARIEDGTWAQLLPGDVATLAGSRSWFPVEDPVPEEIKARLQRGDLHPSGPLWGRGALPSKGSIHALEERIATVHRVLADGLELAGLKQDRRALRAMAEGLCWTWLDASTLGIQCTLEAGSYLTSMLAALGEVSDASLMRDPTS